MFRMALNERQTVSMTLAALSLILTPAVYQFEPSTKMSYDVKVSFDGFLPILGGNEGKADVIMVVDVQGRAKVGSNVAATNEISSCEILFNGAKLPLTLENVIDYFPKTNIEATPGGKIVKNDAPNRRLPVRLPGLDVRRFPDITYLPVEFPEAGITEGSSWTFSKSFGESDLVYTCTPTAIRNDRALIDVKVEQKYDVFEDDALEVVKEADAVAKVETVMTGTGQVTFDLKRGQAVKVRMTNNAVSKSTNIKSKKVTERKLKTDFSVTMKGYDFGGQTAAKTANGGFIETAKGWWQSASTTAVNLWNTGRGYVTLAWLAMTSGTKVVPGLGSIFNQWLGQFRF